MLEISCARCGRKHYAGEEHLGKQLRCAGCGHTVPIAQRDRRHARSPKPLEVCSNALENVMDAFSRKVATICVRSKFRWRRGLLAFSVVACLAAALAAAGYFAGRRYLPAHPGAPDIGATTPLPVGHQLDTAPADPKQTLCQVPAKSLPTGTPFMEDRATDGHGQLKAINNTRYDAYVIVMIAGTGEQVRQRYIQLHSTLTLHHLDRGEYTVLFTTGLNWNGAVKEFNCEASYFEFGEKLGFEETSDSRGVYYVHHSIALHQVLSGNARSKPLTETQFHALASRT
jgi:hypothetical protein